VGRLTAIEAAGRANIHKRTLLLRLKCGWPVAEALGLVPRHSKTVRQIRLRRPDGPPTRSNDLIITPWDEITLAEAATRSGIKADTITQRIARGLCMRDALRPVQHGPW
jgi:hypothetical protein